MCQRSGMQLASIHSAAEMTLVMTLIAQADVTDPNFQPNVWLGMSQGGSQGKGTQLLLDSAQF